MPLFCVEAIESWPTAVYSWWTLACTSSNFDAEVGNFRICVGKEKIMKFRRSAKLRVSFFVSLRDTIILCTIFLLLRFFFSSRFFYSIKRTYFFIFTRNRIFLFASHSFQAIAIFKKKIGSLLFRHLGRFL